jgi:hypothetical protein
LGLAYSFEGGVHFSYMTLEPSNVSPVIGSYPVEAVGYAASFGIPENLKKTILKEYLDRPLLLTKLTERVSELMLQDLRYQRERVRNHE